MNTLRLDRAGLVSLGREPGNAFAGAIDPHTGDMPATVDEALQCAFRLGEAGAVPGTGYTRELWETLASLAAHDLGAARTVEPHLDAIAILAQAGATPLPRVAGRSDCSWGVFAAEGGPDPLVAVQTETTTHNQTGTESTTGWMLVGTKPWCSLAGRLTAALVSASTADGERRLFAVDLAHPGVTVEDAGWQARGLTEIPSGPVRFDNVPVFPVGDAGWYLQRPGFSWGGIGVAACWYGGAVGLARTLFESFAAPSTAASSTTVSSSNATSVAPPDRLALMHLGAIDEQLHVSRLALAEAAALVDAGLAEGAEGRLLAKRVRATVALACEQILWRVGHALGPAPLARDNAHAKRVADLQLYIRQHHAEKDEASLGEALLRGGSMPW